MGIFQENIRFAGSFERIIDLCFKNQFKKIAYIILKHNYPKLNKRKYILHF